MKILNRMLPLALMGAFLTLTPAVAHASPDLGCPKGKHPVTTTWKGDGNAKPMGVGLGLGYERKESECVPNAKAKGAAAHRRPRASGYSSRSRSSARRAE